MATEDGSTEGVTKGDAETVVRSVAPGQKPHQVTPVASSEDLTGSVQIELLSVAWYRNNPKTNRITSWRKGARFSITQAEYDLLSAGPKPSVRKVD